jgi:hypothetical protein
MASRAPKKPARKAPARKPRAALKESAIDPEQDRKALDLRKAGMPPEQIAEMLGYSDALSAALAVRRALDEAPAEPLEETVRLEIERLDAMFKAMWPEALRGNHLKVDRCLQIMERRGLLQGLERVRPELPRKEDALDDLAARRAKRRAGQSAPKDLPGP